MMTPKRKESYFTVLDQASPVRLRLKAATLEDLFHEALEGMACILYRPYSVLTPQIPSSVRVSSLDINSLMVDFLSEALWQGESLKAVFTEMRVKRFTNSEIIADLLGIPAPPRRDRTIISVSYSGTRIVRGERGMWQAEISFQEP